MPQATEPVQAESPQQMLLDCLMTVRRQSEDLCAPLTPEDSVIQAMPDVSPPKWHLAHTTWFFEAFILKRYAPGYREYDAAYHHLFNSYYESLGDLYSRPQRGLIARPTAAEISRYRAYIDDAIQQFIFEANDSLWQRVKPLFEIGLNHEQQHQELLLTDIKYNFSVNPTYPVYQPRKDAPGGNDSPLMFHAFAPELQQIGHDGQTFCFDNETPRHASFIQPFAVANRLITNAEYIAFIEDGGYENPLLWLSAGWDAVRAEQWAAPLYWQRRDGQWWHFTLHGLCPVDPLEPVCHVSQYEADAYARWAGKRLLREAEWEIVANQQTPDGHFVESGRYHPRPLTRPPTEITQMFGDVWEWTASPYVGYPGYQPSEGAVGEYNGKFMSNQMVLRGGSCATPHSHIRPTYRNFFPPNTRWQFTGIRLGEDR